MGQSEILLAGGHIPAGKWGIAGEAGPEPVFGPATVLPHGVFNRVANSNTPSSSGNANIKVVINNSTGAGVRTDERVDADGARMLEVFIDDKIDRALGGQKFQRVMAGGYGIYPRRARR